MDNIEKELGESLQPLLKEMVEASLQQIIDFKKDYNNDSTLKENKTFFLEFLNEFKYLYKGNTEKSDLIQDLIKFFNGI